MLLEVYNLGQRQRIPNGLLEVFYGTQTVNAEPFAAGVQAVAEHPEESGARQRAVEGGHHRLWA